MFGVSETITLSLEIQSRMRCRSLQTFEDHTFYASSLLGQKSVGVIVAAAVAVAVVVEAVILVVNGDNHVTVASWDLTSGLKVQGVESWVGFFAAPNLPIQSVQRTSP